MSGQALAIRGKLLVGTHLEPGVVVVSGDRIAEITRGHARGGDLPGTVIEADIIAPGMIDLQVNGADGVEVDEDPAHIDRISRWLLSTGVTAWLPTVVTASAEHYPRVFAGFAQVDRKARAAPLGLHLEGPFLSPERKGAHQLRYIEAADDALFESWLDVEGIRLVTLAPDRAGGVERIRRLVARGIVVSLGHTNATIDEFLAGVDAGATKATHLFNAMSPIHHREPGAMAATMTDDRVIAGIIPDAVHAHPAMVRLAIRAKGVDGIVIVSDMMAAAGLGDGTYQLAGQEVQVEGIRAHLADGTLAGSVLTMDQAVRNLVEWGGVTPAEALHMATAVPARVIADHSRGRLVTGCRADLSVWTSSLELTHTVLGGRVAWEASGAALRK